MSFIFIIHKKYVQAGGLAIGMHNFHTIATFN